MKYPITAEKCIKEAEEHFGERLDDQMKGFLTVWVDLAIEAYEQGKRDALAQAKALGGTAE